MKKKFLYTMVLSVTVLFLIFAGTVYAADIAVIVNKVNTNDVNRAMVQRIYSGDMPAWPGGGSVAAFDLPEDSSVRAAFSSALLGRSVSSLRAQWAAKLFSGRATPPKVAGSDDDVKRAVAGNKNAIGYIKASNADDSVKTVLTLP